MLSTTNGTYGLNSKERILNALYQTKQRSATHPTSLFRKRAFNGLKLPTQKPRLQKREKVTDMLSRTGTAPSHSLIVASSINASKSFPNLNRKIPRFLGFKQFSPNLSHCSCSGYVSFGWNSSCKRKFNRSRMEGFAVRASAQPLQNADELIDSVETFIFDCDGEFSSSPISP